MSKTNHFPLHLMLLNFSNASHKMDKAHPFLNDGDKICEKGKQNRCKLYARNHINYTNNKNVLRKKKIIVSPIIQLNHYCARPSGRIYPSINVNAVFSRAKTHVFTKHSTLGALASLSIYVNQWHHDVFSLHSTFIVSYIQRHKNCSFLWYSSYPQMDLPNIVRLC